MEREKEKLNFISVHNKIVNICIAKLIIIIRLNKYQ